MTNSTIRFLLNDQPVALDDVDPNLTILQFLRENCRLTGTKEGCASGDCGACTVVLAEVDGERLHYKTINSCIALVATLHGKQLITVEHLRQPGGQLHPVQQALVDSHGSQCGFCTPGFIMSAFALHKNQSQPNRSAVLEALAGNLCRCTGYRSIIDGAMSEAIDTSNDSFSEGEAQNVKQLKRIVKKFELNDAANQCYAPSRIGELAQYLIEHPDARLLAGGTDLALSITQGLGSIDRLVYLGNVVELKQVKALKDSIKIGAAATYSELTPVLGEQYPELAQMIERIGSQQIRNLGTLGGNIGNASPIGDMPPPLIALGATVALRKGAEVREIPLESFFKNYKVTDLKPSEFIQDITVPKAVEGRTFKVYKISKRIDDDISAVLAAFNLEIAEDTVKFASIAFGGMAAIPKRAAACEQALIGKPFTQQTIDEAKLALCRDFQPLSDVRASSEYRMKVAQNLVQKCFIEMTCPSVETSVVSYA